MRGEGRVAGAYKTPVHRAGGQSAREQRRSETRGVLVLLGWLISDMGSCEVWGHIEAIA